MNVISHMILKGLRIGSRTRPEQDSARRTRSGDEYDNIEAWRLGRRSVGFEGVVMVWYIGYGGVKFAGPLRGLIAFGMDGTRKY